MKDIFTKQVTDEVISRINALEVTTQPNWGKMSVDQMLAHCNVTYEMVYENKYSKPMVIKKWLMKTFIKNIVVGEKPFKKNSRTAPEFVMAGDKDFEAEKNRLIAHLQKTQELGGAHFEGKESLSFGPLTKNEWNNMFYKHIDHHLTQFNV
ncbi:hypothetical protein SCB49_00100 [unidentified eubacterium SCB49]|nr:hypothetical protein SCB49_00100 [unidentified eubacterium SCB49]